MPTKNTSEKLSEILFNSYFLRLFELGEVEFYAPSQVEELKLGYDASFTGRSKAWEVILQFKQPEPRTNFFTIKVDPQQLHTLHGIKHRHVYYAAPAHRTHREVADLQRQTTSDPCDFLNTYILLDVNDLPRNTATIRFDRTKNGSFYVPKNARYRCVADSSSEYDHHSVPHLAVCDFASEFQERHLGVEVILGSDNLSPRYANSDDLEQRRSESGLAESLGSLVSQKDLTIIMRLNRYR